MKNLAVGLGVLAVLGVVVYVGVKLVANKEKIVAAVNPLDQNNLANRAANAALGFDNKTESIGTKLYDAVDTVRGWLPFTESDAQRNTRLQAEAADAITANRLLTHPL